MWAVMKTFVATAVVIVALWLVAVFSLNQTIFSPGGFVLGYLQALERGDLGEAIARAGLAEAPLVLPHPDSVVSEPTVVASLATDNDEVLVRATYLLDGIASESLFTVSRLPRVLGLFDRWSFSASPTDQMTVTIRGANEVTINGVTLSETVTAAGIDVLFPGRYTVSWSSGWLETETIDLVLEGPHTEVLGLVAQPTPELSQRVTDAVIGYLTDCTAKAVLQPAGCPFGTTITDRVVGDVVWEITSDPRIQLAMRSDETTWEVSAGNAVVTLTVSVQSLFDGSISPYEENQTVTITGIIRGLDTERPQFIVD